MAVAPDKLQKFIEGIHFKGAGQQPQLHNIALGQVFVNESAFHIFLQFAVPIMDGEEIIHIFIYGGFGGFRDDIGGICNGC